MGFLYIVENFFKNILKFCFTLIKQIFPSYFLKPSFAGLHFQFFVVIFFIQKYIVDSILSIQYI